MRCIFGLLAVLSVSMVFALAFLETTAPAHADQESFKDVRYERCPGWGLCIFRVSLPLTPGNPRDGTLAGTSMRIRLRGVGDPEMSGTCNPERSAARTIREFVEGILKRAGRIDLDDMEPGPDGSVTASVKADGTDVVDILIHIGLGREKPLPPAATWCD